jgi:FtsZ-binding cell division protein ZapB
MGTPRKAPNVKVHVKTDYEKLEERYQQAVDTINQKCGRIEQRSLQDRYDSLRDRCAVESERTLVERAKHKEAFEREPTLRRELLGAQLELAKLRGVLEHLSPPSAQALPDVTSRTMVVAYQPEPGSDPFAVLR